MNSNNMSVVTKKDAKIIVVGAGIAGIAAAERLLSSGFSNVMILEANDRVGGRIFTTGYGKEGGCIDLGAQWIHGQLSNPVYELACKHNLVDYEAQEAYSTKCLDFYMPNGQHIPAAVILETSTILDNIFNEMTRFARGEVMESDETVGSYVQNKFYKYLQNETDSELRRMKEGLFNWRLIMEKTENACASIYDMSLSTWGEYMECAGIDAVELSRGYRPVIDLFLQNIPSSSLVLNTRVQQIQWQNDACDTSSENLSRAKILTSDGRIFLADHVIVTSSLGFLKKYALEMFNPPLPDYKMMAIQRLGFGTVNKIFLEFEKPFWKSQCKGIQFMWYPEDSISLECLEKVSDEEIGMVNEAGDWYRAVHGFDVVAQHRSTLLCGWIAGREAERMESLPDHIVMSVCHELLTLFTGLGEIDMPVRIIRSGWCSEGLSCGSYSYRHIGSTSRDSCSLAEPLYSSSGCAPALMFAGEATHDTYFSTTHGALLSGQREANRLNDYYSHI